MAKPRSYTGANIEISFEMQRCIHARNCFLKLPQVFDPSRRPWVTPDAASAEEIAAMIRSCPSGALTFRRLDQGDDETPPPINRAAVRENGPMELAGDLVVDGQAQTRATLCRCGQSKNMPYCDYSHVEAGFMASGEPAATDKDGIQEGDTGAAEITPIKDGPNRVKGPLEVITGTGGRVQRDTATFLCRCGQSKSKPFCDGSHKEAGFTAPGPAGAG